MGKRKLFIGVVIGAVVGGMSALLDRDTRAYSKHKFNQVKEKSGQIMQHPSQTVRDVRLAFDRVNQQVTGSIQKAINTLEQVEQSLDKATQNVKKIED